MEQVRKKGKTWMYLLVCVLVVLAGLVLGTLCMVDYYGVGVLTVFVFYFSMGGNGGASWDSWLPYTG